MSDTSVGGWPGGAARTGLRRLLLAVVTALVLTALAPWHTGHLGWPERATQFLIATLIWELAMVAAAGHARRRLNATWLDGPLGLVLTVAVASVPATSAVAAMVLLAGGRPGQLPLLYVQSLLLGLVVAFARRGLRQGVGRPAVVAAAAEVPGARPPDTATAFLRRHAPALAGGRLRALQAEDHYLRIHTDIGSALVLLRLRDAVTELGDGAGWQPHRSFWLAADAGGHVARRGQAWQIVLDTGLAVPVSKSAMPAMRAAGYPYQASAVTAPPRDPPLQASYSLPKLCIPAARSGNRDERNPDR